MCKRKYSDNTESVTEHFGYKADNERFKCCIRCRAKSAEQTEKVVVCENCGCVRNGKSIAIHKRRYYCQTYNMEEKPDFEIWLKAQNYAKLPWEYKKILDGDFTVEDYKNYIG